MIRRPPRSTLSSSSAASDVYKRQILESERVALPCKKIGLLCGLFGLVIMCTVVKKNLMTCGTTSWWFLTLIPIPAGVALVLVLRPILLGQQERKRVLGWGGVAGDVEWNQVNTVVYPLVCGLAGVFAGLFGIGGGIVKGPLMIEMGVLPQVSSATAAFMILFTSASACTSYAANNQVKYDLGLFLAVLGFICTVMGQLVVHRVVHSLGRPSILVFIMGSIVGLSTILMCYAVSYTHLRAHETPEHLVCRLLLEKKKKKQSTVQTTSNTITMYRQHNILRI
eukprot:TRINITY_DN1673_c0_g1_i3.p1 TRINITY_DN1673_c0_g1~~TRINITY_DN1673_c0_g1_i3.p1  ORF type:complete len:281 (+),score=51.81 TRINITY_DN1673_c0_g1_i3:143-985(+)